MRNFLLLVVGLLLAFDLFAEEPDFVFANTEGKIPVEKYKNYHYVSFPMESKLTAYLTLKNEQLTSIEVSPKSKDTNVDLIQNTASIILYDPGYYMVLVNKKYKFFIFADKPNHPELANSINILDLEIDNSGKTNVTKQLQDALNRSARENRLLYFPAGVYKTFPLVIESNTQVYLDKNAVIKADISDIKHFQSTDDLKTKRFIYIKNAENVKICGQGSIDGSGRALRDKYGEDARMRLMMIFKSKNVSIGGLMFKDPGSWNTQILCSEDIQFKHVKLMNDVELSNTDGFDPDASRRVLIENCFAYCSDDNVAIKITNYSGYHQNVEDITVRGCVFLTKKSSLKIGTETRGDLIRNILFEDNDVIQSDRGMALYVSDGATLENIRYINNRFEYNFPDAKRCGIHFVVDKRNENSKLGEIRDVWVKDCTFETPFPRSSEIKSEGNESRLNAIIHNLVIAGKRCDSLEEANIKTNNAAVSINDFKHGVTQSLFTE